MMNQLPTEGSLSPAGADGFGRLLMRQGAVSNTPGQQGPMGFQPRPRNPYEPAPTDSTNPGFNPMGFPHGFQGHQNQGMLPSPTPMQPMATNGGWNMAALAQTNPQSVFNEGGPRGGGPLGFPPVDSTTPGTDGYHPPPLGFPNGPMGFEPRPRNPYESAPPPGNPIATDPSKFNPMGQMRQKGPFHDPRTTMAPPQGGNDGNMFNWGMSNNRAY